MDLNCPDGMDCPWWPICNDDKPDDDVCPLLDSGKDNYKPIDKQIMEW